MFHTFADHSLVNTDQYTWLNHRFDITLTLEESTQIQRSISENAHQLMLDDKPCGR